MLCWQLNDTGVRQFWKPTAGHPLRDLGRTGIPADFDVCWDMTHVDLTTLYAAEPVLFDFRNRRAAQKAKFSGELFPSQQPADSLGQTFLDFFQQDKNTGQPKGIVAVDLGSLQ